MRRGQTTIGRTLMALTTLASVAALVTASVAFGLYDRSAFETMLARRLGWQAQMVAVNSASAVVFDDPATAGITIGAVEATPNVVRAAIYRADGSRFAEYHRLGASPSPDRIPAAARRSFDPLFVGDLLTLARPIVLEGRTVGTVTIESDLSELSSRQRDYLEMAAVILFVSLAAALLMSWRSQRTISRPIVGLAALASTVSRDRDYSHRANVREGTREVRTLARTFNLMLAQIEEQNRSLQRAHDELEERVRLRTAELHALNKELESFSYSVSHDLRAPLRHVAGFAELLEEHAGPLLDDQSKSYLSKITTAARRMGKLIDDLLGFSRVGRTALNIRTVDLDAAVQEARQEAEADASPARPIEWVIGALPPIEADPALLHQVLVNLMANAVKYSATREHPRIEIGAADPIDGQVVVFVRDNGVGFDMKYVDKLFGVFQRLHSASDFPGTGIGLANVQRIVMRHGGRVWAEAEIDRGATFYLAWPRSKGAV